VVNLAPQYSRQELLEALTSYKRTFARKAVATFCPLQVSRTVATGLAAPAGAHLYDVACRTRIWSR
jgi:hypothetical protein